MSPRYRIILVYIFLLSGYSTLKAVQDSAKVSVKIVAGTGSYFMDHSCLNRWFKTYNYPTLPSGAGLGGIGLAWNWDRWIAGLQLNTASSGVTKQSGYSMAYQTNALDMLIAYTILRTQHLRLSTAAVMEFRNIEISLERSLSSQSNLNDLLAHSNGFMQNTGATLKNSARNIGCGLILESNRIKHRTNIGLKAIASAGSRSRWNLNEQPLYDSPNNGLRGIQVQAFISFRL